MKAAADTDLVHLPALAVGQVVWAPLCGAAGKLMSPQPGQVTCGECLRIHDGRPA